MSRPAAYMKYVRRLVKFFRSEVMADEYHTKTEFVKHLTDRDGEWAEGVADADIDPEYLWVVFRFTDLLLEFWQKGNYYPVAETICHECCHILTEPLFNAALPAFTKSTMNFLYDVRERQTQRTSNALMARIPRRLWLPTKEERPPKNNDTDTGD